MHFISNMNYAYDNVILDMIDKEMNLDYFYDKENSLIFVKITHSTINHPIL